jgi:hypothetical protein
MELETKVFKVILDLRGFKVFKETKELVEQLVVKVYRESKESKEFKVQRQDLDKFLLEQWFGLQPILLHLDICSVMVLQLVDWYIMHFLVLYQQIGDLVMDLVLSIFQTLEENLLEDGLILVQ